MKDARLKRLFVTLLVLSGFVVIYLSAAYPQSTAAQNAQNSSDRSNKSSGNSANAEQPWFTLPAGTVIQVRIADEVDSSKDHPGDLITGTVDPSVLVDNHAVIPRGTEAHIHIMEDKKGHALGGKAKVQLELVALVMNREKVDVDGSDYKRDQGALSYKVKSATRGAASSSTAVGAASATPETGAVNPIIAVFSAAKVNLRPGSRIPFHLRSDLTFEEPVSTDAEAR